MIVSKRITTMKEMNRNFMILNSLVKKMAKLLILIFFLILVKYGLLKVYYPKHYINATPTTVIRNNTSKCELKKTCSALANKKCFCISTVKNHITTITEILDELKAGNRQTFCNRFITVGAYMGRTGNQMFEIASLLGTAYKYDIIPLIPATYPIINYFDLPNIIKPDLNQLSNVVKCFANKSAVYYNFTEEMKAGMNVSLHGHLQSWKYFFEAKCILRTVFKFKQKYLDRARDFLSHVTLDGYKRVCVHIRRGDFTSAMMQKRGYITGGLDFIEKARAFFKRKYSKVQFIVVSDDKAWCRMNIKRSNISSLNDPGEDLALMSLCDDVVFSSSTFGWWGAWLSEGTTIYFNKFPIPGSKIASRMSKEDFYPSDWTGLS